MVTIGELNTNFSKTVPIEQTWKINILAKTKINATVIIKCSLLKQTCYFIVAATFTNLIISFIS